eukprot:Gregarina_sp_Poly_1__2742@NODE_175_length_12037_cov_139_596324_g155_i0_p4_GENE_NODE_175_length_12037_cov_139_596324_g155_i0NODE_175_length_12037_cov_139_596324_g155_i0_p4_ORF_typecomplete_len554_score104_31SIR2/PF02146_17/0_008SIR2/PF02146_17/1_7e21_NODE_175_length_12037_cov_139_596324_g155_i036275288
MDELASVTVPSPNLASGCDTELALLRRILFESNAKVLFITGAGISVKSGIPLYRSDRECVKQRTASEQSSHSDGEGMTHIRHNGDGDANPDVVSEEEDVDEDATTTAGPDSQQLLSPDREMKGRHRKFVSLSNDPQVKQEEAYVSISDDDDEECFQRSLECEIINAKTEKKEEYSMDRDEDMSSDDSGGPMAIWDAKLEALCQKQSFMVDPRQWFKYFWFDTHHVDSFLKALPNESHFSIGMLCDKFQDRIRCVTQNVDGLHQRGGCPPSNLIEVHGRVGVYRCCFEKCPNGSLNAVYPKDIQFLTKEEEAAWDAASRLEQNPRIRRLFEIEKERAATTRVAPSSFPVNDDFPLPCCAECRGPLLPMTLMFDEAYQTHAFFHFDKVCQWMEQAEVLVFVGTSFSVFFTEHAVQMARYRRKQVFNVNVVRDSEVFCGFSEGDVFPDRETTGFETKDRKLRFNWDSGASEDEGDASFRSRGLRRRLTDESDDSGASVASWSQQHRATIHHIVAPAEEALTNVLPEPYRLEVERKLGASRTARWKQLWDASCTAGW